MGHATAAAIGDEDIETGQGDGYPFPALEDLVEETVLRIAVVLGVADVPVFVEDHAVQDPALFANRHGLDHELAATGRNRVEMGAAFRYREFRVQRPAHQEHAGFQLVILDANR